MTASCWRAQHLLSARERGGEGWVRWAVGLREASFSPSPSEGERDTSAVGLPSGDLLASTYQSQYRSRKTVERSRGIADCIRKRLVISRIA